MDDRYDNFRVSRPPQPRPRTPIDPLVRAKPVYNAPPAPQPQPVYHQPAPTPAPVPRPTPAHHQPVAHHPVNHQPEPVRHQPAPVHHQHPSQQPVHHPVSHEAPLRQHHQPVKKRKKSAGKKILTFILIILGLGVLGAGGYAGYKYGYKPYIADKNMVQTLQNSNQDPVTQLTNQLNKVIDLPTEVPRIVTIQDANVVNVNPFFSKAANGDQVVYYENAKVAVLYRPTTKKVINYSPNATIGVTNDTAKQ